MIICAGDTESFPFAKSIGIGMHDSIINLTKVCLHCIPKRIIFIGSAGSYDNEIEIGTILYSFCATQIELSFLENNSYTPINNVIKIESFNNVSCETLLQNNNANIQQVNVNSSNYITNTSRFNNMMLHAGIKLENMEFFSILKVTQHFQIPCIGFFCVSNHVGENAHQEFLTNHNFVKQKLTDFITHHTKFFEKLH